VDPIFLLFPAFPMTQNVSFPHV